MLAMSAGRPVAFQITSATVMQSLFIPALGSQIYAMDDMVTQLHLQADQPGLFLGENTMYNGSGFHQQKFAAVAMTPDDFAAWVGKVRTGGSALDEQSLRVIAQRTTRAELATALPEARSPDGNLYFNGAPAALFPAVVKATKDGTAVALTKGPRKPTNADSAGAHAARQPVKNATP